MADLTYREIRELRNDLARINTAHDVQRREYERMMATADPIRERLAAAETTWNGLTAEWDTLRNRDGRPPDDRSLLADLRAVAEKRRDGYRILSVAMSEKVLEDFRMAGLREDLKRLADDRDEIRRLLKRPAE